MVEKVAVMLSRSVDVLPTEGPWAYEPKLDGFRCLLSISDFGDVRLDSRRAKPLGRYFPEVIAAARLLPPELVLDGELVIAAGGGVDFAALPPGARSWQKLRARDTAEAVIGGVFGTLERPEALVLGRYRGGRLRVVGRTSPLPLAARAQLQRLLRPPSRQHSWPVRLPSRRFGQTPGGEIEYTQIEPELVVEVETDTAYEQGRWRHATTYLRLRPDLAPRELAADSA